MRFAKACSSALRVVAAVVGRAEEEKRAMPATRVSPRMARTAATPSTRLRTGLSAPRCRGAIVITQRLRASLRRYEKPAAFRCQNGKQAPVRGGGPSTERRRDEMN